MIEVKRSHRFAIIHLTTIKPSELNLRDMRIER